MVLFRKKKENTEVFSKKSEEFVLKNELETEVENLQNEFGAKQEELNGISEKIKTVKEEYDSTVSSLMLVKKEFNQKRMDLDIAQREYKEIREKMKNFDQIKNLKTINQFNKTDEEISKKTQELEEFTKKYHEIKEQVSQEQSTLYNIRKAQLEVEKELEEANSRLFNTKNELDKKDQFLDISILTPSEKKFIEGENNNQKSSAGIIEAASVMVGSLKSKLNMTQKEIEMIQTLLEKEREEHEKTKQELENLKSQKINY